MLEYEHNIQISNRSGQGCLQGRALATLPDYSHRFSPQKFTQSQLFVCLTLKTFFKTDYRGIVSYLRDLSDLRRAFHLTVVPHYTTLQKAAKRLLAVKSADRLLEATM